ncbi:MAG: SufE family protein [Candidatus Walczuchella monophlebidarum]
MQEVIEEFSIFDNWEDKYIYLIELGKKLKTIPSYLRSEDKLILGCNSRVWLHAYVKQNKIFFQASSDAIIPRGIIALMLRIYSGRFLDHIIYSEPEFLLKIGLSSFLSPIRANGMEAMFKQIKQYAMAFKCLPVSKYITLY